MRSHVASRAVPSAHLRPRNTAASTRVGATVLMCQSVQTLVADALSEEDARAIQAYVLDRAWREESVVEQALELAAEHVCLPVSWITD